MPASFELFRDKSEEFRWRLRHSNGQIIAGPGQGYTSKASAIGGIESVKRNSAEALIEDHTGAGEPQSSGSIGNSDATFEVYLDSADEFRWRMRHDNGEIIAEPGQGYTSKQNAIGGLESVKLNAADAKIEDLTVVERVTPEQSTTEAAEIGETEKNLTADSPKNGPSAKPWWKRLLGI